MQFPKILAWLDTKLGHQRVPCTAVHGQRIAPPAAPVQSEHQLRAKPFTQRMFPDQPFQLGHKLVMPARVQPGLQPPLDRLQPQRINHRHMLVPQRRRRDVR